MTLSTLNRIKTLRQALAEGWSLQGLNGVRLVLSRYTGQLPERWAKFWMCHAGRSFLGRLATWLATMAPVSYAIYYHRGYFSELSPRGFISPSAKIHHPDIRLGLHVFVGENVLIMQDIGGGSVELGERVRVRSEAIFHTGDGGSIEIGAHTWVGPRCQLAAYRSNIIIGSRVLIGGSCSFFPYDHGMDRTKPYIEQPLQSRGPIVIEDDVWLGTGAVFLSGVRIGKGAVIGAGAVVTRDVPAGARALGVPARVVRERAYKSPDAHSEIIIVRATDGTIWSCNSRTEQLYGWRAQEAVGQKSHRLLQTVFPVPLERIEAQLQAQGYWEGHLIHTRRDGSHVMVVSRWELLSTAGDGGCPGVLEVNREMLPPSAFPQVMETSTERPKS